MFFHIICLSLCTYNNFTYCSDLHKNFTGNVSLDKKDNIKSWNSSGFGSGSKKFLNEFFIARQHAMHAERDIVLPICPTVCPMPVLCLNEWMDRSLHF